jgi:class 3 adenylate cyclase
VDDRGDELHAGTPWEGGRPQYRAGEQPRATRQRPSTRSSSPGFERVPRQSPDLDASTAPSVHSRSRWEDATTDASAPSIARGFLFADLRGYSAWVERHGDQAASVLIGEYRELVRRAVAEHRGAEIKTEGDSFYVVFDSPSMAVKCGLRIVELAAASTAAAGGPIPVGVGVHAGETVATGEGFIGSAVNVAARVCSQARAGELLVTDAVRSLTRTYLDVAFLALGRRRLKGISEPISLYRVTPGRVADSAPAWRRVAANWPLVAAAVAIPLILVVAVIGGALVRELAAGPPADGSRPPSIAATTSVSPTTSSPADDAFPTAAEAALVELVPDQYRDACQRADPADNPILGVDRIPGEPTVVHRAQSAAGIECDLGGISAPDRLSLWELTRGGIRVGEANAPRIAIVTLSGLVGASPGSCREERPTIEEFTFGSVSGTMVCHESTTGDAVLTWTYDGSQFFARALRDDRDMAALLDWWEDAGRFIAP